MKRLAVIPLALALAVPAEAADTVLELPMGAVVSADGSQGDQDFMIAIGPASDGDVATQLVRGDVFRTAWRFPLGGVTTARIMDTVRGQLRAAGYNALLDCADRRCGGFDFRFGIDLLPEPGMHVDLGDFRYVSAVRETAEGPTYLQVVVSRSPNNGFVELTSVEPAADREISATTKAPSAAEPQAPAASGALTDLVENGFAELGGLTFRTGSAELDRPDSAALDELAAILRARPDLTIALVGHTDAVGSLTANIALSRKRAQSVMEALAGRYGIARNRMEADGVGYLAPVASNQSEAGRAKNRRVEVIITSTR